MLIWTIYVENEPVEIEDDGGFEELESKTAPSGLAALD